MEIHATVAVPASRATGISIRKPQPQMVTCRCAWCKAPFEARVADRKRGWAKFCSKSCKASKQEKRTGQFRARSLCAPRNPDADHERALHESTAGWDEGGWRNDDSGCSPA